MKKYFTLALLNLCYLMAAAQSGDSRLFVKIYGNYALPTSGSYRNSTYTSSVINQDYSVKSVKDGLGMGLRAGAGIGMVLNDFINIGLDVENYFGKPIKSGSVYYYDNQAGLVTISNNVIDYKAGMIFISPNITFKALSQPNFYIYNRLSLKFGFVTSITEKWNGEYNERYVEDINVDPNPTDHITTYKQDYEYEGGLPYGFSAALGFQLKMSDKIRFFTEVEFTQLTYNPKKRVMTLWVGNDGNEIDLDALDKIQVETEYKKNYTVLDGQTKLNEPNPQPTLRMPFSSIGLGAGFVYRL